MSKFGTLVQIKKPPVIDKNTNISFQIGRSVISFSLKKNFTLIPKCLQLNCLNNKTTAKESDNYEILTMGIPPHGIFILNIISSNAEIIDTCDNTNQNISNVNNTLNNAINTNITNLADTRY